jgi:hypothetical protein
VRRRWWRECRGNFGCGGPLLSLRRDAKLKHPDCSSFFEAKWTVRASPRKSIHTEISRLRSHGLPVENSGVD